MYIVRMSDLRFEWDDQKSQANKRKHNVSFEEAQSVGAENMREHYDFDKMKGQKNPYTKGLKQPVTMRIDKPTVAYFKSLAEELGMPYQSLINLYLRECALQHKKLQITWAS
jgi:uncharacterized DUF497 family protein